MRTWHYEFIVFALVVCLTTWLFQNNAINWITTVAIMLTFNHAQIADRLQEDQQNKPSPTVPCYWKLNKLFIAKEIMWITAFFWMHNYAAIIGSVLFAIYPKWRKIYRTQNPKPNVPVINYPGGHFRGYPRRTDEPLQ